MLSKNDILDFWFEKTEPKYWFVKSDEFDQSIKEKFSDILLRASRSELWAWRSDPEGSLAEIIILDQFSRNIYRNLPQAFAADPLALSLSQAAIDKGFPSQLPPVKRSFLYMPFMHSESAQVHEHAVRLFSEPGLEEQLKYEYAHKKIIDQFGRYPHRNECLNRESTIEELSFLKQPGSSF